MISTDPRVAGAEALLTGPRLLAGHGTGLIRPHDIARLLQQSIWERQSLIDWLQTEKLWHEPPFAGPLAERPLAGTVDIAKLRAALKRGLASPEGLPFGHNLALGK